MKKTFSILSVVALLSACAVPQGLPEYKLSTVFDEKAAQYALLPGSNTLKGNAFLRQQGGGVVTCAGSPVLLIPSTTYAKERFIALYGNDDAGYLDRQKYKFVPDEPAYQKLLFTATCDSSGNFVFENVSDGNFFVMTMVTWRANSQQGGSLFRRVNLHGSKVQSTILTLQ